MANHSLTWNCSAAFAPLCTLSFIFKWAEFLSHIWGILFCRIYFQSLQQLGHIMTQYIRVNFRVFLITCVQHTLGKDKTNIHALGGIWTRDPVYNHLRRAPQTAWPLDWQSIFIECNG
jgi:hypothetical protein